MTRKSRRCRSDQNGNFDYRPLEPRQLLTTFTYEPGFDPLVGATITAFSDADPRNPSDSYDIQTNWIRAVEELALIGADQVNFAVYRRVDANGSLSGGADFVSVKAAVARANELGLSVSLLPVFETGDGWRGDYNPQGEAQTTFRAEYTQFVLALADIDNVDRLTVASELNALLADANNNDFFDNLIQSVADSDFEGDIGFTANFDVLETEASRRIWANSNLDYLGVSAYGSLIDDLDLVSGTGEVSQEAFDAMVATWNRELDRLERLGDEFDLDVLIQEFGSVKRNYTSVFPAAVRPGDFVNGDFPDQGADDPLEQRATYESLLQAIDGRGDQIIGVNFWSWEHGADRGQRTFNQIGGVINQFAIWPTDGAGGTALTEFLATRNNGGDQGANAEDGDDNTNDDSGTNVDLSSQLPPAELIQSLTADNGQAGDRFGFSVAVDGNFAAIGSPFHDSGGLVGNGAVYLYELQNDGWQHTSTLFSPSERNGDLFGWSVDIQDEVLVVGSLNADQYGFNSGAAHVFELDAESSDWNLTQTLDASNARRGDRFGVSVAIEGDTIAVGNRFGDGGALNTGTVSLFQRTDSASWNEVSVIFSGQTDVEQFGWDVDLYQNQILVGAPRSETGSAYLFQFDELSESPTLVASLTDESQSTGDRFGHAVSISSSGAFVGAILHDHDGIINTGAVYRFDSTTGDFLQKLTTETPRRGDLFGYDVVALGEQVFASGINIDSTGINSGQVIGFEVTDNVFSEFRRLDPTEGYSRFGQAIAVDDGLILAGSLTHENGPANQGEVQAIVDEAILIAIDETSDAANTEEVVL